MAHVLSKMKLVVDDTQTENSSGVVELAKELGLDLQAKRYSKEPAEAAFTALTEDEVILWNDYCPTKYSDNSTSARPTREIKNYGFDTIPIEVLKHWKEIKNRFVFDHYEIWTTERTSAKDPLLIGVLGTRLYLLARWGLESPERQSLKTIAQQLCDQYRQAAYEKGGWYDYPFQSTESAVKSRMKCFEENSSRFAAAKRYLGIA